MAIGDGPLGVVLADDVAVELGDDLARGQILQVVLGGVLSRW